ncbi:Cytochrome c oxidase subunit 3, partial [Armadillidium nasatum]
LFLVGGLRIILSIIQWWRDVVRERTFQGLHTIKVRSGLQWGIVLFIVSELSYWLQELLLRELITAYLIQSILRLFLGVYFTALQAFEYIEASFSIADSVYGSTFFVATGFHGLHVLIGTTFLLICFVRLIKAHFSPAHHFGFEAAAWYWHFVDVVWLFLYISIY